MRPAYAETGHGAALIAVAVAVVLAVALMTAALALDWTQTDVTLTCPAGQHTVTSHHGDWTTYRCGRR